MGSAGMKRKGRKHLPKAGTRPDQAWERHEGVTHIEHPFSDDPSRRRGAWAAVVAIVVVVALVLSLIGWLFLT